MPKNTTNIDTTNDLTKREDVITELMMDNFDLKINKDSRFVEKGRKIFFNKISYYNFNDKKKKIKSTKVLKEKKSQDFNLEVNGIMHKIQFNLKNTKVRKASKNEDSSKDKTYLKTYSSNSLNKNEENNNPNEKEEFHTKKFQDAIGDAIGEQIFILEITNTNHEVDGNLVAQNDINIRKGLKEILYYPKIEENIQKLKKNQQKTKANKKKA